MEPFMELSRRRGPNARARVSGNRNGWLGDAWQGCTGSFTSHYQALLGWVWLGDGGRWQPVGFQLGYPSPAGTRGKPVYGIAGSSGVLVRQALSQSTSGTSGDGTAPW